MLGILSEHQGEPGIPSAPGALTAVKRKEASQQQLRSPAPEPLSETFSVQSFWLSEKEPGLHVPVLVLGLCLHTMYQACAV